MHQLGGDRWTFGTSRDANVEFCVWALRRDGLHVAPFDRHTGGDGRLQAAGLTAASWSAWLDAVVRSAAEATDRLTHGFSDRFEAHYREVGTPPTPAELMAMHPSVQLAGVEVHEWFAGPAEAGRLLGVLSSEYDAERRARTERDREAFERAASDGAAGQERAARSRHLWDGIQRHRPLPPLHFYLVDYPEPVLAVVPPAAVVIGGRHQPLDEDPAYDRLVLETAAQLTTG